MLMSATFKAYFSVLDHDATVSQKQFLSMVIGHGCRGTACICEAAATSEASMPLLTPGNSQSDTSHPAMTREARAVADTPSLALAPLLGESALIASAQAPLIER